MFLLFVGAVGAFGLFEIEDVLSGVGAGFPLGAVVSAGLEASGVESVDLGVGVVFGGADAGGAAVESASSVLVGGLELAGLSVGGVCAAAAVSEFFFGLVDGVYPVLVPFFGAGGAEFGCFCFGC